jgi:hypothetical protein
MKKLHIDYNATTETIEDTYGDEGPYTGYRETSIDLTVNKLTRNAVEAFGEDLIVDDETFNAKVGYLVIVRYRTGSTFGSESGCYSFIAVFPNREDADKLANEIESNVKVKDDYTFHPKTKNVAYEKEGIYCSWKGYFERLEHVDVKLLDIV